MSKYERLTDNRIGKGWYQPKSKDEARELLSKSNIAVEELYNRLLEFENIGVSPDTLKEIINCINEERLTERTSCGVANIYLPKTCYFENGTKDMIAVSAQRQMVIEKLAHLEDLACEV